MSKIPLKLAGKERHGRKTSSFSFAAFIASFYSPPFDGTGKRNDIHACSIDASKQHKKKLRVSHVHWIKSVCRYPLVFNWLENIVQNVHIASRAGGEKIGRGKEKYVDLPYLFAPRCCWCIHRYFMNFHFAHTFHFFAWTGEENEKFMEKLIKQKICVYSVCGENGIYYILLEFN